MKLSILLGILPLVSCYVIPAQRRLSFPAEDPVLGVGVHFTASSAIAAARYESGHVQDLVLVRGREEYLRTMERWADAEYRRRCDTRWEKLQCNVAQASRRMNKWVGRPATTDVRILASLIQEVKTNVENILQIKAEERGSFGPVPLTNILPVFANLPALEKEDIQDALAYVGLAWNRQSSGIYHETNAAYAGLGRGICASWKNKTTCEKEEADMEAENVLFLNYDSFSFSATLQTLSIAFGQPFFFSSAIDANLGWQALPVYEVARAKYWAQIQELILGVVDHVHKVDRVILTGQFGNDAELGEVLRGALWEALEVDVEGFLVEATSGVNEWDGWMAAARGAAEMSGRAEWLRKHGSAELEEAVEL